MYCMGYRDTVNFTYIQICVNYRGLAQKGVTLATVAICHVSKFYKSKIWHTKPPTVLILAFDMHNSKFHITVQVEFGVSQA